MKAISYVETMSAKACICWRLLSNILMGRRHVREELGVPERRACQVLDQHRSTQRYEPKIKDDAPRLVAGIVQLATQYGRYGYRRITALLREEGWWANHKRVQRIWRQEGLKVPRRHSPDGRALGGTQIALLNGKEGRRAPT